jgi:D-glycero-D-manno-heptose 1,7-bisphosphate phosphatase
MPAAVFLDRDGTMVYDVGYLGRLEDLEWFPWTIDAIRLINRAGLLAIVTTNQGGVGLGVISEDFVREVHGRMAARIEQGGGRVDAWFYCPHHPRATVDALRVACECRKPQPGMIRQAQRQFEIDLGQSFVIGDKLADLEMAEFVGAQGVLVRTGYGEGEWARHGGRVPGAAHVAANLIEAVTWILDRLGHPLETP